MEYKDIIVAATVEPCNPSKAGGNCPKAPVLISPLIIIPNTSKMKKGLVNDLFIEILNSKSPIGPFSNLLTASVPKAFKPFSSGDFSNINQLTGRDITSIITA